jgi:hypothetical protein
MHAEFMESMQLKYHDAALAKGCFAASAVGFDCVAAEIGAALCAEALARNAGTPHHIESVLTLGWGRHGAAGHFATLCGLEHDSHCISTCMTLRCIVNRTCMWLCTMEPTGTVAARSIDLQCNIYCFFLLSVMFWRVQYTEAINQKCPTAINCTINHAKTSLSTEIFAGEITSVAQC